MSRDVSPGFHAYTALEGLLIVHLNLKEEPYELALFLSPGCTI